MLLADLLRQSVYSRLAGYEDVNDAEQLSHDPTFRLIGSEKNWDRGAALPSRLQTFETDLLAEEENFAGLARVNRELIGRTEAIHSHYRTVLDMDSTEIPVYGEQEQSAYNGHFESDLLSPSLGATDWPHQAARTGPQRASNRPPPLSCREIIACQRLEAYYRAGRRPKSEIPVHTTNCGSYFRR